MVLHYNDLWCPLLTWLSAFTLARLELAYALLPRTLFQIVVVVHPSPPQSSAAGCHVRCKVLHLALLSHITYFSWFDPGLSSLFEVSLGDPCLLTFCLPLTILTLKLPPSQHFCSSFCFKNCFCKGTKQNYQNDTVFHT